MLDALINQVKDCSETKRQKFADQVSKHFTDRAHLNRPEEISTFNNLLDGVYDELDTDARETLSKRLASLDAVSPDLAFKLANDEAQVAAQMLRQTRVLSDDQLISIAETKGQEHLLALSKREYISPSLSRKLIEKGNAKVKESIAVNIGADISKEEIEELIKSLPSELGNKIRHLRKSTEDLIQELFRDMSDIMTGAELVKRESRIDIKQWLTGIRQGHVTLNKAISQIALEKNLYDLASLLSVVTGINRSYVANLMVRYDSTGISVLCRAMGVHDGEYSAICKARCAHLKFPSTTGNKWVTNYHVLDPADAKRMMDVLRAKLKAANKTVKDRPNEFASSRVTG
ncbi:DUF2336 domain-containing protein [Roseibium algae]|uniref:DUF2336 domain-containing protein n=1 Tax=Roseibium algae TaxID=3123038 RepID=A0ABU8TII8_9HYPH